MDNEPKSTILIVDDNHNNLSVLYEHLTESGYRAITAENGMEAIKKAKRIKPDLILLDILMPDMDGFTTCEKLKSEEETEKCPIIFLSALSETLDKVKGFSVGAVDYITKPFQKLEVIARIETHLTIQKQKKIIERQNQELNELNENKNKFFSIIAHDLRSPIGGLLSVSKLLLNYSQNKNNIPYDIVESLFQSTENAYKLLENLLQWSRVQMNRIECIPVSFHLSKMVEALVNNLNNIAYRKDIKIKYNINPEIKVFADFSMTETIIRNLLTNSIKFTPIGGLIEIQANTDKQFVDISVIDNGVGIKESELDRLFKINVKYSRNGTLGESGTGLGLIICKELVEKNKGKISVKSSKGIGSTFTVSLPFSE